MTDLQLLKKRIFDDERIEELLDLLKCGSISTEQNGGLFVASLPDGENTRSVQVRNNEDLTSNIRSRGVSGDIFHIVSYIKYDAEKKEDFDKNLPRSKYWICKQLGYLEFVDDFYKETMFETAPKPQYNSWLRKAVQKDPVEFAENKILKESILERYKKIPFFGWLEEGICYRTQQEFGVGIDIQSDRVVFPVHDRYGNLIGVKGRYCGVDEEIEARYKYIYLVPCNKSVEFYNLHRALPYIREKKEVIVLEGAKSVMLLSTWGYKNAISIEGDSMTDAQINILKSLGLDVKLVFAWDKDKSLEYVKGEVQRVHGRQRYAIADINNLLSGTDSPIDRGRDVWETLYKENSYRIR